MSVGIVKHGIYLEHVIDDYHPESPERLRRIYAMLDEMDSDGLAFIPPRAATHEEIELVHEAAYVEAVAATKGKSHVRLDPDTATSPKSYEAALMAAGGFLALLDAIERAEAASGFALVRPPGHHAERSAAMGFCLFNNIAIGARYLEKAYGLGRILIADFDLHHGNGTQHAFYNENEVLYFSTHQHPYYPGSGGFREVGEGKGKGYTVNVPLPYGMGDDDYEYIYRGVLAPLADRYQPEIVLVSAGFDAYYNDPLGGMTVTENGFAAMAKVLLEIADQHCKGKVACVLEGGYDLTGLASSVRAVITELKREGADGPHTEISPSKEAVEVGGKVRKVLEPFWGGF